MNKAEQALLEDRANRNAARSLFDTRLASVKGDLAARSIGGRIADKAKSDAASAARQGLAVAKESKGIIAGTLGALALWAFRKKLAAAAETMLARLHGTAALAHEDAYADSLTEKEPDGE